ncbi:MAG: hypothetical protein AB7Y46_04480 [Armatimonadota bacterium]
MRLRIMREIAKYDVDSQMIDVKVINQVVYLGGSISRIRRPGAPTNLQKVVADLEDTIRAMRGVNDVVVDVRIN